MKPKYHILICTLLLISNCSLVAQNKILFDASKGQEAGNADWVIDSDLHNLGIGSSGSYIGGFESNPQRYPTPLQATITAATPESYWQGALSYWAIDCVKKGYAVETLPWDGQITFGVASNPQDLSNYKAFIVDEPNLVYNAAQKNAIVSFVANGGGLFIIADHDVSDRNGDGFDSPHIWNDLMLTNTIQPNPFGVTFDYVDISQTSSNIRNLPLDPILHGATGNVTQVKISGGSTMTLNTTDNSSVKGVIFKTGAATTGLVNVLCAYGTYGNGKFAAMGDSSPMEDGTGDPGDVLYDGYITDAAGNHQRLLMNITNWLMTPSTLETPSFENSNLNLFVFPNPIQNQEINISYFLDLADPITLSIFDTLGRKIIENTDTNVVVGRNYKTINASEMSSGIYICKVANGTFSKTIQVLVK